VHTLSSSQTLLHLNIHAKKYTKEHETLPPRSSTRSAVSAVSDCKTETLSAPSKKLAVARISGQKRPEHKFPSHSRKLATRFNTRLNKQHRCASLTIQIQRL
jgi:hypothetical protein